MRLASSVLCLGAMIHMAYADTAAGNNAALSPAVGNVVATNAVAQPAGSYTRELTLKQLGRLDTMSGHHEPARCRSLGCSEL